MISMTHLVILILSREEHKEFTVHGFASGAYSNRYISRYIPIAPRGETVTIPRLIDQ